MEKRTIAVAMSGGVDSSTSAALLLEQGHRVFGLTMLLLPCQDERVEKSCCGARHLADARAVCAKLDIPHYTVDLRAEFHREVVAPFLAQYLAGRTPNPCALCNSALKFRALLAKALALGADALATGHYVRLRQDPGGPVRLLAAADRAKDQSYFLFALGQRELASLRFPLGALGKAEVRGKALALGLSVHDKAESQDACFLPPGGVGEFIRREAPAALRPGPVLDTSGKRIGTHPGACLFTVGQRKGLGVAGAGRLYVVKIDAAENTVVLGTREEASSTSLLAGGASWVAGAPPGREFTARVRIRHRHRPAEALVRAAGEDGFTAEFAEPQPGVAPGQAAAVYGGDELLGGGWIA